MYVSKYLTLLESKVCRRFLIKHHNIIIIVPVLNMEHVNIDDNLVATINCPALSGRSCPRWHQQEVSRSNIISLLPSKAGVGDTFVQCHREQLHCFWNLADGNRWSAAWPGDWTILAE